MAGLTAGVAQTVAALQATVKTLSMQIAMHQKYLEQQEVDLKGIHDANATRFEKVEESLGVAVLDVNG